MSDQKRATRRGLLRGAAVGAGAAAAAALPLGAAAQDARVVEADVAVIGMGFAGLVAGLKAAQLGASVAIMDKMPAGDWIGGSMMLSGQIIHVAMASPMLDEDFLRDTITERTAGRPQEPYAELMETYLANVKRGMQWLMDLGVEFEEEPGLELRLKPAKPADYGYAWGKLQPDGDYDYRDYGGYKTAKILETALTDAGANMLYETKAMALFIDELGTVIGVSAVDPEGRLEVHAKATILCTGGYARNKGMSAKYMGPHGEEIPVQSCPGNTGDGIAMALKLGAAMRNNGYSYWWPCPAVVEEDPWHPTLGMRNIDDIATQSIIVIPTGERVCDESEGRFTYGAEMFRRGYVKGLMVFDSTVQEMEAIGPLLERVVEMGGTVYEADSLEELAELAGVAPYLATTVAEFNAAVDDGSIATARVPKKDKQNKIETAPFYGLPFINGTLFHYGGLQINTNGQILDVDEKPIPGLFGAGELIGGSLSGGTVNRFGAYTGHLAGACLTYGILAAESAAALAGIEVAG
ncbi:MAG: FAD-dependent oxidoreductase [Anaerolineae bacterium]|nr:FAD-dependent oxidoreductase [Anaerolineae bacterium]